MVIKCTLKKEKKDMSYVFYSKRQHGNSFTLKDVDVSALPNIKKMCDVEIISATSEEKAVFASIIIKKPVVAKPSPDDRAAIKEIQKQLDETAKSLSDVVELSHSKDEMLKNQADVILELEEKAKSLEAQNADLKKALDELEEERKAFIASADSITETVTEEPEKVETAKTEKKSEAKKPKTSRTRKPKATPAVK